MERIEFSVSDYRESTVSEETTFSTEELKYELEKISEDRKKKYKSKDLNIYSQIQRVVYTLKSCLYFTNTMNQICRTRHLQQKKK